MNFAKTVAVIIARPFLAAVTHGGVRTKDRWIAVRFIGIDDATRPGAAMDVSTQGLGRGIGFDPHPDVSGVAPHPADNRRTVLGVGAAPTALVRSAARRVSRVTLGCSFSPPRFGTFRHCLLPYPARRRSVAVVWPALGARGAHSHRRVANAQVPRQGAAGLALQDAPS